MTATAREYLVNRFQADAVALRDRVALMARGTKVPGPDAATSRRMADSCDDVAALLLALAHTGDAHADLDAIMALLPLLEQRADGQKSNPAVRSVYAGAATRIREICAAESQAAPLDGTMSEAIDASELDALTGDLPLDDDPDDDHLDDDVDDDDVIDGDDADDDTGRAP